MTCIGPLLVSRQVNKNMSFAKTGRFTLLYDHYLDIKTSNVILILNTRLYRFYYFFLVTNKANENQTPIFFLFCMRMPTFPPKNGRQEPTKHAHLELWCSIRCKQNLHSIDFNDLNSEKNCKNFELVKSFKILACLLLYDCSLSLGQSWLWTNKSTDINAYFLCYSDLSCL